ncbi:MAG: hypothetical protein QGH15_18805 [Kiritimatiellia bacterium]|jgi:hypothetical protein|nr:hypothetical protein [Kiritimatiellia bacterium]
MKKFQSIFTAAVLVVGTLHATEIEVTGSRKVSVGKLQNGALLHRNRGYAYTKLPKAVHGRAYTLHDHKATSQLQVTVKQGGELMLCLFDKLDPEEVVTGMKWAEFGTAGSTAGGEVVTLYRTTVTSGQAFTLKAADKWGAILVVDKIGGLKAGPIATATAKSAPVNSGERPKERDDEYVHLLAELKNKGWHNKVAKQTLRPESLILSGDRDPTDVVLRRTEALLNHLIGLDNAPSLDAEAKQLATLKEQVTKVPVTDTKARNTIYEQVCVLRRKIAFANPLLKGLDQLIFLTHHMAYYGHICDQYIGHNQKVGGGFYLLDKPFSDQPEVKDMLEGVTVDSGRMKGKALEGGSFISLELSFDGNTALFAWTQAAAPPGIHSKWPTIRKDCYHELWTEDAAFHIFSLDLKTRRLTQLTDGQHNDFDPCFLPNGRIAFISERRGGYGRCHPRPVPTYTLYSMRPDGSDIICLSYHETNEWHPSVDNDGMILYSRWDYVDRDSDVAHHIWLTYPDGRDPRSYHGNYPKRRNSRPWAEQSARAIPGSPRYIAVSTAHHGQNYGPLIQIDHQVPDDGACSQVKRITPEAPFPESERGKRDPKARRYGTPWPLSEDFYLCVYDGAGHHFGLYLVDSFGNRELLHRDPTVPCLDPIPLRPRPVPPNIPAKTTQAAEDRRGKDFPATISVVNVYDAELPWPEGTKIKALRIVELFAKTAPMNGDPRIGIAAQSLARGVLGTVPVESDGSAYFEAPLGVPIYFQALDERGLAVQTMRSATYVHQGEQMTCQGCHEPKHRAIPPRTTVPLAMRRAPSKIVPEMSGSYPVSFPVLVQPMLDKKCVACHAKEKKAGELSGTKFSGHGWSQAYAALGKFAWFKQGGNGAIRGNKTSYSIPGQVGARASKLFAILEKGHYDVKLTPEELRRITLWMDCNSNFYGAYYNTADQARGKIIIPKLSDQFRGKVAGR